jgi:hypothetical protein
VALSGHDGGVVGRERDDGGLDRDAAPLFERERIGLGWAVIDAAELVVTPAAMNAVRIPAPWSIGASE